MAIDAKPRKSSSPSSFNGSKIWLFSVLLSLQYGAQPLISKCFIRMLVIAILLWLVIFLEAYKKSGNGFSSIPLNTLIREVIVTSSVLMCEVVKVVLAIVFMSKEGTLLKSLWQWSLTDSLIASGLPAAIYALQNSLLQVSYRNLDSLTFSMLNQTKIFFTALFLYIILRQRQSIQQIGALFLLIMAAILLSIGEGSSKGSSSNNPDQILFYGIIPVMVASVLSGLASSLCQWASQVKKHSSYLMTIEMSIVRCLCLLVSTLKSPDGEAIRKYGFFCGWTPLTFIPVVSNAVGGILVGLITSYAGGVRKGFVIVSALLVTALLQFIFEGKPPSHYCLVALPLVAGSISIYQKYPYRVKKKEA